MTQQYSEIIKETNLAWALIWPGVNITWFPKSKCSINTEKKTITIPDWLAHKKGLCNEDYLMYNYYPKSPNEDDFDDFDELNAQDFGFDPF